MGVSADRINKRAAKDRAFLKRALRNPGLRSKLDPKYLSKPQQASRALNTRLNAPITPGSTTTERDLAHAAQAATTVKYGPTEREYQKTLGEAQTTERDTGSFYDQYLAQLQQHQQNVAAYQAGAQQALAQTAQGITGLSGQQGAQMQQAANQSAQQQGVAPAGDLTQMANAATATRQALIGSFQGQQASQGAAANTYASTQANVVGPGQKLAAQAQARGKVRDAREDITKLKTLEGAYNQQFRDERRQNEFKNVLAQQTLVGNQAIAGARVAADAAKNDPTTVVSTASAKTTATEEAKNAAKLGMSVHDYRMLGPTARAKRLKDLKTTTKGSASDTRYTSGPFAGMFKSDVNALSDKDAQAKVDAYAKTGGKGKSVEASTQYKRDFRRKYGIDPLTTEAHNTFRDQVSQGQRAFKLVGQTVKLKDGTSKKMTTNDIVAALSSGSSKGIPKLPALVVRAALEIARGGLTAGTANRLHHAGYSVATLGYKMGKPKKPKPAYKPPSSGPASKIPGVGGN